MGEGTDYKRFVEELEARLEMLNIELGRAKYEHYLGLHDVDLNEIESKLSEIYLDAQNFEKLAQASASKLDRVTRPVVDRLRRWFAANQVNRHPEVFKLRNELQREILSTRPVVGGNEVRRAQAHDILQKEKDRALREEAYFCELPLAQRIRARVLELVKMRRDLARELGAENYPEFVLLLQDMNIGDIQLLFDLLEQQTASAFRNYLQQAAAEEGIDQIMDWDVAYLLWKQRLPDNAFPEGGILPAVKEVFGGLGFNIDALGIDIKFRDIPYGGLCFTIKVPEDVRVLADPQAGHSHYVTLFHELGHAIYSKLVAQKHYALQRDTSSCFTEGIAVLMSRFAENREWLSERKGLTEKQLDDYLDQLVFTRIYRLRSLCQQALLEYSIYEDPDQDIEVQSAQLMRKFMMAKAYPSELWAANPFYVNHPVYLQNYVIAEMIAQQIYDYLKGHYTALLGNRVVSKFMVRNFFASGGAAPWRGKIEFVTDKPLGPEALLASLGVK